MENKIPMTRLAAMLAITTGKQKRLCEDFLKEIFRIVADELAKGEGVRIKGFGTFKLSVVESRRSVNVATGEDNEIPAHRKVVFLAAKELASAVNAQFEAFEAVEISDDIPTDMMLDEDVDIEMDDTELYSLAEEHEPASKITEEPDSEILAEESEEESAEDQASEEAYAPEMLPASYEPSYYDDEEEKPANRKRFIWGFLSGFVAAAAVGVLFWLLWIRPLASEVAQIKEIAAADVTPVVVDSGAKTVDTVVGDTVTPHAVDETEVATKPSDSPVYDTISKTRFLTTMAQEHYGNFNLWPIIYEENKSFLGHPDRIKPGTKVVVPPLSKYGVDPKNPADVKRVKQQGLDIYARYK